MSEKRDMYNFRCVHLWPVSGRCRLGSQKCPSYRAHAQSAVHTGASCTRLRNQPGEGEIYQSVRLPGLQETEENRSYLHFPAPTENKQKSRSLDAPWRRIAL